MEPQVAEVALSREVTLPVYRDGKRVDYSVAKYSVSVKGANSSEVRKEMDAQASAQDEEYQNDFGDGGAKAKTVASVPGFTAEQVQFLKDFDAEFKLKLASLAFLNGYAAVKASIVEQVGGEAAFNAKRDMVLASRNKK